jgi:hypothetical protein
MRRPPSQEQALRVRRALQVRRASPRPVPAPGPASAARQVRQPGLERASPPAWRLPEQEQVWVPARKPQQRPAWLPPEWRGGGAVAAFGAAGAGTGAAEGAAGADGAAAGAAGADDAGAAGAAAAAAAGFTSGFLSGVEAGAETGAWTAGLISVASGSRVAAAGAGGAAGGGADGADGVAGAAGALAMNTVAQGSTPRGMKIVASLAAGSGAVFRISLYAPITTGTPGWSTAAGTLRPATQTPFWLFWSTTE